MEGFTFAMAIDLNMGNYQIKWEMDAQKQSYQDSRFSKCYVKTDPGI
jgi:hypothetical protein